MGGQNSMIREGCAGLRRLRWRKGQGLEAPSVLSSGRNAARSGQILQWCYRVEKVLKDLPGRIFLVI